MILMRGNPGYYEQHYETLRREALSSQGGLARGHGLALFLSRGMVAWMMALATLKPPRTNGLEQSFAGSGPSHPKLTRSICSELTTVLAGMVLACRRSPTHE
jgi:hypothetical protein